MKKARKDVLKVEVRYISAPDGEQRLHRAFDIILGSLPKKEAVERDEKGKQKEKALF